MFVASVALTEVTLLLIHEPVVFNVSFRVALQVTPPSTHCMWAVLIEAAAAESLGYASIDIDVVGDLVRGIAARIRGMKPAPLIRRAIESGRIVLEVSDSGAELQALGQLVRGIGKPGKLVVLVI